MKISVVTVCYNAVDLIEATIESVAAQTYRDVEYIVIDGASKDGTKEVIERHSDKITHWVSEPDKGIYDAMNKGIEAATGDYIIFMNAGDRFAESNVIEKVVPSLGRHTVVTGHWRRCYSDGTKKKASPKALDAFRLEMPICHQATFISLPYHKANPYDTSYRLSADYAFFYKAWKNGETFSYIDHVIADFIEAQGASTDNITKSVMERKRAWQGEKDLFLRDLNLRYQILRIKAIKLAKKLLK